MKGGASTARFTMGARWSALVILAAAAVLFPLVFSSPVVTNYGVFALIFVTAASAWNVFSGFSGYISLGQAVFFGSGAYAVGIAARDWNITGVGVFGLLPLAAAVGAAIAVPFGLVALRVRRHTFIVITIAVFFIFQLMAFNFSFTGGSSGLPAPFLPWQAATYNDPFYYIALACAVAIIVSGLADPAGQVRPAAAGDQGRRGPRPGARGAGDAGEARCVHAVRDGDGADRRRVVPLPHAGRAADRLRPAVRPFDRADGVPRRARHHCRSRARRAHHRAGPALPHDPLHERVLRRDPARHDIPRGRAVRAARHHPDRRRMDPPTDDQGPLGAPGFSRRRRRAECRKDPKGRSGAPAPRTRLPRRLLARLRHDQAKRPRGRPDK